MTWDEWLKKYGKLLSDAWKVAFDVLQERGEEPPGVVFLVRRKKADYESIPGYNELTDHRKVYLKDRNELLYRSTDGMWTTFDGAKRYNSLKAAKSAARFARKTNEVFESNDLASDIEIVYCSLNPIHIETWAIGKYNDSPE